MIPWTRYVWRCGTRFASMDMTDADMERLADTEFGIRSMLSEVSRVLGYTNDHTHIFSENKDSPEGTVIFDCPCKGKVGPLTNDESRKVTLNGFY